MWRGAHCLPSYLDPCPSMHKQHLACMLMSRVKAPSLNACPESDHAMYRSVELAPTAGGVVKLFTGPV